MSGVHPLKEPGYPSLAVCLMTAAIRGALKNGPLTPRQLETRLGVNRQVLGAAVPWLERWDWAFWDGERLTLVTPADTFMRGD